MSALHWICALTLALVCCLSAQPVKREVDLTLRLVNELEKIIETRDTCPNDMKLYTPTNIKLDCLSSALNCTLQELKVFREECEITEDDDSGVIIDLYTELKRKWDTSFSTNCSCESYPQKDVNQFVNAIKDLVKQLNSNKTMTRLT